MRRNIGPADAGPAGPAAMALESTWFESESESSGPESESESESKHLDQTECQKVVLVK